MRLYFDVEKVRPGALTFAIKGGGSVTLTDETPRKAVWLDEAQAEAILNTPGHLILGKPTRVLDKAPKDKAASVTFLGRVYIYTDTGEIVLSVLKPAPNKPTAAQIRKGAK